MGRAYSMLLKAEEIYLKFNCIWQVENDEFGNEKMQSLPSR